MINKWSLLIFLSSCIIGTTNLYAQTNPDDIALKTDAFENHFYEGVKQRAIENYDKAILENQKCLTIQPNSAAVYNELGRNFLSLKNYPEAQKAFDKAIALNPKERWYWNGLYDVFYETKDYNNSIVVVQKLIEFDKKFQDDMVSLYMYTQQYDKALALIEEMEQTVGTSSTLELYKSQILSTRKQAKPKATELEAAILKNPNEEQNYIDLIYFYSENNQEEKAMEVAKKLEQNLPNSDWAQVSLFKFHLNKRDGAKAAQAMLRSLNSSKVDTKIKHRIVNEFLIFVNTTNSFFDELNKATDLFTDSGEVNVNKEIGIFFLNKKKIEPALFYLEKSLRIHKDDISVIEMIIQITIESGQFDQALQKATNFISIYPTQPKLYYFAALAANQLRNFADALSFLKSGIDFVVEDKALEVNFYIQMGEAYHGLGDEKNKEIYFTKAEKLLKQK